MRRIIWNWLVSPIEADVPEHCSHVSLLLCLFHLQTDSVSCSKLTQDKPETGRREEDTLKPQSGRQPNCSSFRPYWNEICLFCRKEFPFEDVPYSVKGVRRPIRVEIVDAVSLEEKSFSCDFMCTLLWYWRKDSKVSQSNACQGNSNDYLFKQTYMNVACLHQEPHPQLDKEYPQMIWNGQCPLFLTWEQSSLLMTYMIWSWLSIIVKQEISKCRLRIVAFS